jgi:hypothetical protein
MSTEPVNPNPTSSTDYPVTQQTPLNKPSFGSALKVINPLTGLEEPRTFPDSYYADNALVGITPLTINAGTSMPPLQNTSPKTGTHTHTCRWFHNTTCAYTVSCSLEMYIVPSTAQNRIDEMCLVCHNLRYENYAR